MVASLEKKTKEHKIVNPEIEKNRNLDQKKNPTYIS
jgi:hypothetical protein